MQLIKASIHDIHFLNEVKHSGIADCALLGNKGYGSEPIQQDLFTTRQIKLITPVKSGQHDKEPFPFILMKSRKRIETFKISVGFLIAQRVFYRVIIYQNLNNDLKSQIPRRCCRIRRTDIHSRWTGFCKKSVAILDWVKYAGLTSVELMGGAVEEYAGAPVYDGPAFARDVQMSGQQRSEMMAVRQRHAEAMKQWRLTVSMDRFRDLCKMYNDAGVNIDITKLGRPDWTDEEIDCAFNV